MQVARSCDARSDSNEAAEVAAAAAAAQVDGEVAKVTVAVVYANYEVVEATTAA